MSTARTSPSLPRSRAAGPASDRRARIRALTLGQTREHLRALLLHDMRSPLTAIQWHAQMTRTCAAMDRTKVGVMLASLLGIEEAARRLAQLLDQLEDLELTLDGKPAPLRRQPSDLVELVRRGVAETVPDSRQQGRIAVRPAVRDLVGRWDPARLERVIANLLGNALKYSPKDRDVVLTVERQGDQAVLEVRDRGIGIPAREVSRVFKPFYRASNVAERFPGRGIGLVGVREIVEAHGGTVALQSRLGVGTTVTVRLPLAEAPLGVCASTDPVRESLR